MLIFKITDSQERKLKEWQGQHPCKFRKPGGTFRYTGSFGGADTFHFTPTSIGGVLVTAHCACGAEIDLTEDFSNW